MRRVRPGPAPQGSGSGVSSGGSHPPAGSLKNPKPSGGPCGCPPTCLLNFLPCQPEAGPWPPIIAQGLSSPLCWTSDTHRRAWPLPAAGPGHPSLHKPCPLSAARPQATILAQGLSSLRWLLARMVQVLTRTSPRSCTCHTLYKMAPRLFCFPLLLSY